MLMLKILASFSLYGENLRLINLFIPNITHEKIYAFWLVKNSAVFFSENLIQYKKRKQTKDSDWSMIRETHRWPIKFFVFKSSAHPGWRNWWRKTSFQSYADPSPVRNTRSEDCGKRASFQDGGKFGSVVFKLFIIRFVFSLNKSTEQWNRIFSVLVNR